MREDTIIIGPRAQGTNETAKPCTTVVIFVFVGGGDDDDAMMDRCARMMMNVRSDEER